MHARNRSPGNGVRSNPMGMGLAASRISPEGSIRSPGMYTSEYRNYNRGFGRGRSKPYPPPQPPRRGDIFIEAGRLAAEYLASQGLLSPNMLPPKWQNGTLKNQMGELHEFRSQDRESLQLPHEGRMSALSRLGNVVPDAGSARRRFSDEFNPAGSRNHMRGKRRTGPFRVYGSDWSRENGRSGSWSEKTKFLQEMDGEDEFVSGYHHEERRAGLDVGGGAAKAVSNEFPLKIDTVGESESGLESYEFSDDMCSKASSSSTRKEFLPEADGESSKGSDDSKVLSVETREVKECTSNDEMEKQDNSKDFSMQYCSVEGDPINKDGIDLLRLCSFAKVPTRTRSSLTYKGSKVDPIPAAEEENTSDIVTPKGPKVLMEGHSVEGTSNDMLTTRVDNSKFLGTNISRPIPIQSVEDDGELSREFTVEKAKCTRSQSFPDSSSFMYEQELGQGPPGFGRCSSMGIARGEKRTGVHDDVIEGTKKQREWSSSMVTRANEYFHLHNLSAKQSRSPNESLSPDEEVVEVVDVVDQDNLVDVALFSKGEAESSIGFREEKQLFPSSFKICDLNLMEASDMNENHDGDPFLCLASTLEAKKEASVDVDLSISNSCNRSDDYDRLPTESKEVVVVDAANDSLKEDKAFNIPERKAETVYSGLETFPNHTESTGDLPDAQDGYGLMISELLGADISNCSSVQANIPSLHTEMGLHNGEGILGDDDPIYLSLGEIPISMPDI